MTHARPLRVASAFPDPPFEVAGARPTGFDHDLGAAIAAILHRPVELHRYEGPTSTGSSPGSGRRSTWFADSDPEATRVVT